ncbi:sensor histidine kinase [Ktedonobacter robiniae]|uniref:histidine kinase n=1 Tax=Ktedonobacter robiniae TaxID=2778365 RepID=A0ABQ3UKC6_9CHLR|nr:ATP-binding protein [Ktedonobacter robiniae]GHO53105.1 hypothetical protein KSB_15800 [Ktedonobacter robiniae]
MRRFSWLSLWLNRLPLRWRVALVSFGLLALILITMGIVVSSVEEQVLLSNQLSALNTQAGILIQTSGGQSNIRANSQPLSKEMAGKIAGSAQNFVDKSTLVTILSPDGHLLAQSDGRTNSTYLFSFEQEQQLLQQLHKQGHADMVATTPNGQRELVVRYSILAMDKQSMTYAGGILQLQSSTTVIDSAVSSTRLLLFIAIAIGLLVAALLTLPLIRQALRPLTEIERASMRIASGDLTQRLSEPPTQDELGRLATAFNGMVIRLEHMFARQKQFVADVSHELRTPLTGLGGSLEMLLLEADNGDAAAKRRLVLGMYNEVERMQRLVSDLLVLSRLDEGQVKLRKTHIDLCQLLTNVKEQADILAQGQHITLDLPKQSLSIEGDSDQLRRVFLNLIENAIKFTPPGGDITLRALGKQCEGRSLACVEITDTGLGIPASALPHIFDRFYRVDQARIRTTAQSGSGLGLSIAQGLVQAHGGTITLTSTPNQGTTVTLQFPIIGCCHALT